MNKIKRIKDGLILTCIYCDDFDENSKGINYVFIDSDGKRYDLSEKRILKGNEFEIIE